MVYVRCLGVYGEFWLVFVVGEEEIRKKKIMNLRIDNLYGPYGLLIRIQIADPYEPYKLTIRMDIQIVFLFIY